MRKYISLLLLLVVVSWNASAVSAAKIRIFQSHGYNMAPLRYVAEWLGAKITTDKHLNGITIELNGETVTLQINADTLLSPSGTTTLPTAPLMKENVVYVPVSMFQKMFGIELKWMPELKAILLFNSNSDSTLMLPITPADFNMTELQLDLLNFRHEKAKERIQTDADWGTADGYGMTPIHYATMLFDLEMLESMLTHGGDLNSKGQDSMNPLHTAIALNSPYFDMLKASRSCYLLNGIAGTKKEIVEWLLNNGADINAARADGKTPLQLTANIGDDEMAEFLLAKGANVNARDKEGCTSLHESAIFGNIKITKIILNHGGSINVTDNEGWTPLHHAVSQGQYEMTKYLVDSGASVNVKTKERKPVMTTAEEFWKSDGSSLEKVTPITISCSYMTPLHIAVLRNGELPKSKGSAITDLTSNNTQLDIARYLISKGADLSATAYGGLTPLHYAAASRLCSYDLLDLIFKSAPKKVLKMKTNNGSTPYDMAVYNYNSTGVKLLQKYGGK